MMCRELCFNTLTTTELPMGQHARHGFLVLGKTTVGIVGQIFSTLLSHTQCCVIITLFLSKVDTSIFFDDKVFMFRNSQRTQSLSVTMANLIMFIEIFSVYCQNHRNQINTLCGQNTKFLNVTAGGL